MRKVLLCLFLVALSLMVFSQIQPTPSKRRIEGFKDKASLEDNSLINHISFQSIGPSIMGGRVVDIDVNPNNSIEFYVAYATGGVWYTRNNGQSFIPITDNLEIISMGDIAVNWKDRIIWIGTGESNAQGNSLAGVGVYKSLDNGNSWEHLGLSESHHISKIIIHPNNTKIVWVSAMGHSRSVNEERGIFKTIDGGLTWNHVLFVNDSTGIIDMDINKKNPKEIIAASWSYSRSIPGNPRYNGGNSGIYKSTDAGLSWSLVTLNSSGFLSGDSIGRIGLSIYQKNPSIIYAMVDNRRLRAESGKSIADKIKPIGAEIYRSSNGGLYWEKMNTELLDIYSRNGWYFGKIQVSPVNDKKIVAGGITLVLSNDGGKSFTKINSPLLHVDHHAAWINPQNDNHFIVGNDGGCNITYDNGQHWFKANSPAVGQYYSIATDNSTIYGKYYNIYGGLQDNHVWMGPSYKNDPYRWQAEGNYPFKLVPTMPGDGMQVQIDKSNNQFVYAGVEYGQYLRIDLNNKSSRSISVGGDTVRKSWETPILLSPLSQEIFYYGTNRLYRSLKRGDSLIAISHDLTRGKKGGSNHLGAITTISESPDEFGLLYTGSDDGLIYRSMNGGENWKLLNDTLKNSTILPNNLWVTRIIASRYSKGRVYAAMSGYVYDNFEPFLFVSENFGENWKLINRGLPCESVYVIREDHKNENILYIGTEGGLYVSINRGQSWMAWNKGLPRCVPVKDIAIQERENEIVLGTFGRSLYIAKLDDVQQLYKDREWMKKKKMEMSKEIEIKDLKQEPEEEEEEKE